LGCRRYQQGSLHQHRGAVRLEEGSNSEAEQDVRDLVSETDERDERAARRAMMRKHA
jgi:hypothetical protein